MCYHLLVNTAVSFRNFSVKFGDFIAVDDISLDIAEGDFVAIVGANGAGKSTLLKSLLGIATGNLKEGVVAQQGAVEIFGKRPADSPPELTGYVPQVKSFDRSFPALAVEVVVSGLRRTWPFRISRDERTVAENMLESVGIAHLANRRVGRLSGGELQRVYLARSLIRKPKLLLLDEPATGIDAVGEADLYRHLEAYQKNNRATILMITHDWEAAEHHASHVLILNRKIIGFGSPKEMLTHGYLAKAFGHVGHVHGKVG